MPQVEARLWSEGEADAGRRLLFPDRPPGDTPVARPVAELLAEGAQPQTEGFEDE